MIGEMQLTKSEEKRSLVDVDFKNLQQRLVLAEREIVHLKEEVCLVFSFFFFAWLKNSAIE